MTNDTSFQALVMAAMKFAADHNDMTLADGIARMIRDRDVASTMHEQSLCAEQFVRSRIGASDIAMPARFAYVCGTGAGDGLILQAHDPEAQAIVDTCAKLGTKARVEVRIVP